MSSGIVDQITLECLMNKDLYQKLVTNKKREQDKKTDYKLYRKRITALTKGLLANEVQTDLMQDVEYAFNNYMKACIRHFKITDECEQIQQTNSSMESVNESVEEEPDDLKEKPNDTKEEIKEDSKDVSMLKSIKFPNGTLDGFVNYQI
jgi:hypothetical protein